MTLGGRYIGHRCHALGLLAKLPPDTILDAHNSTTAGQWKEHLPKQTLSNGLS